MLVWMGFYTFSSLDWLIFVSCIADLFLFLLPLHPLPSAPFPLHLSPPSPSSPWFDSLKIFTYPNHTVTTPVIIFWISVKIKLSLWKTCVTTIRTTTNNTNAKRMVRIIKTDMQNWFLSSFFLPQQISLLQFLEKIWYSSESEKKNMAQVVITAIKTVTPHNGSVITPSKIHSKWWHAMNTAG